MTGSGLVQVYANYTGRHMFDLILSFTLCVTILLLELTFKSDYFEEMQQEGDASRERSLWKQEADSFNLLQKLVHIHVSRVIKLVG
jgi:hypothetical protein